MEKASIMNATTSTASRPAGKRARPRLRPMLLGAALCAAPLSIVPTMADAQSVI